MGTTIENDTMLVREFRELSKKMAFVGFKYSKKLWVDGKPKNRTRDAINGLRDILPLSKQVESVRTLWTELLGDAIVFLKYNDHREGDWHDDHAFGVESLSKLFQTLGSFEGSMSPILTRSRDHLVHVVRLYLLSSVVLSSPEMGFGAIDCGDEEFRDVPIRFKKTSVGSEDNDGSSLRKYQFVISKEEKEAMWCIIALCHDLGLVLENVFTINQQARQMFEQLGRVTMRELEYGTSPMFHSICDLVLKQISSDIRKMPTASTKGTTRPELDKESGQEEDSDGATEIVQFQIHVQPKYYQKYMVALDNYDHGVLSCAILLKNLIYFLESDSQLDLVKPLKPEDARQFLIRKNILRAIASHNCESIYHISFMNFPFLLLLFDEMQEWDRPRPYMFNNESVPKATLTYDMGPDKVDFEIMFQESDTDIYHYEIKKYAERKFNKFRKVLRCAVDVTPRIDLKFTIKDKTGNRDWAYLFHHVDPSPSGVTEAMPKDKAWKDFFEPSKRREP